MVNCTGMTKYGQRPPIPLVIILGRNSDLFGYVNFLNLARSDSDRLSWCFTLPKSESKCKIERELIPILPFRFCIILTYGVLYIQAWPLFETSFYF